MGYLHIPNLYKEQKILELDEVYATEKIHGTSAHVRYKKDELGFFSGGEKHANFVALFDEEFLKEALSSFGVDHIVINGEAYGGKCQGMRETYGNEFKFIVFDVRFNGNWLQVPRAADVAKFLKLDFVHYVKIGTNLCDIDRLRDMDSMQAIRNGMGEGKMREGIVLRPLEELVDERGNRIIVKHKRAEFMETTTPRKVDPEKQLVLKEANAIAEEWVTPMRLQHIMTIIKVMRHMKDGQPLDMTNTGDMISAMTEDIYREAKGEIVESQMVKRAVAKRTARLFKQTFIDNLKGTQGDKEAEARENN